jgi:hypothetical protein
MILATTSRYYNPWLVFGALSGFALFVLIGGGTRFVRVLACMQLIDILVLLTSLCRKDTCRFHVTSFHATARSI